MLYSRMLFGRPRHSCRLTRPFPAPSALAPSSSLRISGNSRSSANDHPTRSAFRSRLPAKVYLFAANVYPLPRKGYLLAAKVYLQDELSPHNKVALFAGNKSSFRRPGSGDRSSRAIRVASTAEGTSELLRVGKGVASGTRNSRYRVKTRRINTYRIGELSSLRMNTCRKLVPLWGAQKSTNRMSFCALTKSGGRANVSSRGRLAIKSFRLISLQRNTEQMPWNDILTKKPGGGWGVSSTTTLAFGLRGA